MRKVKKSIDFLRNDKAVQDLSEPLVEQADKTIDAFKSFGQALGRLGVAYYERRKENSNTLRNSEKSTTENTSARIYPRPIASTITTHAIEEHGFIRLALNPRADDTVRAAGAIDYINCQRMCASGGYNNSRNNALAERPTGLSILGTVIVSAITVLAVLLILIV